MELAQRVQMEALGNYFFFCTLTYDDKHLPSLKTSTGYTIRYCDLHHIRLFLQALRDNNVFPRPFRVFYVSERGTLRARPHYHLLFLLPKSESDDKYFASSLGETLFFPVMKYWRTNVSSNRKSPIYEPLFEYHEKYIGGKLKRNYDFHFVEPSLTSGGVLDCAFYVCKYMLKISEHERKLQQALRLNLPASEYIDVWPKVRSRVIYSKFFGLNPNSDGVPDPAIISYLRDCVKRSDASLGYPCFFNPDTGQSFPLCQYYKSNGSIFTLKDQYNFYYNSSDKDNLLTGSEKIRTYENKIQSFRRSLSRGLDYDLDYLCD